MTQPPKLLEQHAPPIALESLYQDTYSFVATVERDEAVCFAGVAFGRARNPESLDQIEGASVVDERTFGVVELKVDLCVVPTAESAIGVKGRAANRVIVRCSQEAQRLVRRAFPERPEVAFESGVLATCPESTRQPAERPQDNQEDDGECLEEKASPSSLEDVIDVAQRFAQRRRKVAPLDPYRCSVPPHPPIVPRRRRIFR